MPNPSESLAETPFLRACRGQSVAHVPVWLMRQAGRYQAEYRAIREKVSFLELCKTPDLAAEVTVFAARQLNADAAILFADILLILEPMGLPISYGVDGDGPKILTPITSSAHIDQLRGDIDAPASLGYVQQTIRQIRREIPHTPLIGFAGAPFTLASYAIEGGGSKNYVATKSLLYRDPGAFRTLLAKFTEATVRYLRAQIDAGVQVVQLFDSWAGALSPADYREHVLPHMKHLVQSLPPEVPVITFATGTSAYLEDIAACGAPVVGVDWRVDLATAAARLPGRSVQGNLDPVALFAPLPELRRQVTSLLDTMRGRAGYIFNLGHGILPHTPVDNARALVDLVHELTSA